MACLASKEREGLRTWIEVQTRALLHNYKIFRGTIKKDRRLMAVAKSNAYGHDLVQFAKTEEKLGVDWFGVDSITEAAALRREGIKRPILVLGHTLPARLREANKKNISVTLSDFCGLRAIRALRFTRPLKVHIKVDTGMHRQGFSVEELPSALNKIKALRGKLVAEGLYTHFAAAKNPAFPGETMKQLNEFKRAAHMFYLSGEKPICHAAATSGTLLFPQSHLDMVRVGIGLYGLWPSKEVRAHLADRIALRPALSLMAVIGEIKELPKGSRVGYDFTETLRRDSRVAILPIGYWHGVPRSLSSIGNVLVRGKMARMLGRVSMDMVSIDVTDIPRARVGDEAIVMGSSGAPYADELAYLADTVNYEIITRLNPLIKRFYF